MCPRQQSFMTITPMLYCIKYKEKEILFVHTGMVGGVVAHYFILEEKPSTKFIELNKMTSNYKFTRMPLETIVSLSISPS